MSKPAGVIALTGRSSAARTAPDLTVSDFGAAPFVFFDGVAGHGSLNGSIQVELVASTIVAAGDGTVRREAVIVGRLRCTEPAAKTLRDAIDAALGLAKLLRDEPGASTAADAAKAN